MIKLVLLRHGQSTWNQQDLFTGWTDVELSEQGIGEAKTAGRLLSEGGFKFDLAYTSVLKRAIDTLAIVLKEMHEDNLPVKRSWKLNERHYGALQGLNKAETAKKYGEEQVHVWRRSYDVPPPALTKEDPRYPGNDPIYSELTESELPLTECLKDTVERFLPYWDEEIKPQIEGGKNILIVAHGNTLRALVKYLDNVSDAEIPDLNIPTGVPLVYELDDMLKPIRHYYLESGE